MKATFSQVRHPSHPGRGCGSLTCHMTHFEQSDWLRSPNLTNIMIECEIEHDLYTHQTLFFPRFFSCVKGWGKLTLCDNWRLHSTFWPSAPKWPCLPFCEPRRVISWDPSEQNCDHTEQSATPLPSIASRSGVPLSIVNMGKWQMVKTSWQLISHKTHRQWKPKDKPVAKDKQTTVLP